MSRTQVAVEITQEAVRAVEVRTGRSPVILAAGSVPLPAGAANDSEVLDQDAVALALRQLWSRAGIKGRRVTLALGSRRILVREYTTQAMRPELLRQALPFQVQDLLPVPADQAVLDFYPVAQEGDQLSGLLVAAVAETVEQLIATLGKAKLAIDVVDLLPFGLVRAVTPFARPGETSAIVHVTDHTTYVVIALDNTPRFVRIIPLDVPTTALRQRMREEQAESEETEEGTGEELDDLFSLHPEGTGPRRSRKSMRMSESVGSSTASPAVADLVHRLRNTVQFANSRPGAQPVAVTYLSGAGAAVDGLHAALNQVLGTRVEYVDASGVASARRELDRELSLDLVGTLGVVLGEGN